MKSTHAQWWYNVISIISIIATTQRAAKAMQQHKNIQLWQRNVARDIWKNPEANLVDTINKFNQFKPAPTEWVCSACTFCNPATASICQVCANNPTHPPHTEPELANRSSVSASPQEIKESDAMNSAQDRHVYHDTTLPTWIKYVDHNAQHYFTPDRSDQNPIVPPLHEFLRVLGNTTQNQCGVLSQSLNFDRDVLKKIVAPGAQICCMGDIHGSLGALLRNLRKLQEKEIGFLDENFRVKDKNNLMVFTGDYINYGKHNIGVIYTLLLLVEANPNNVFLLKGNHEVESFVRGNHEIFLSAWKLEDYAQSNQDIRMTAFPSPHNPQDPNNIWTQLTINFFNKLPIVLFLGIDGKWIQCCHGGVEPAWDHRPFLASDATALVDYKTQCTAKPEIIDPLVPYLDKTKSWPKMIQLRGHNPKSIPEKDISGYIWSEFYNYNTSDHVDYAYKWKSKTAQSDIAQKIAQALNIVGWIRGHQHSWYGVKIGRNGIPASLLAKIKSPKGNFGKKYPLANFAFNEIEETPILTLSTASETELKPESSDSYDEPYDSFIIFDTQQPWTIYVHEEIIQPDIQPFWSPQSKITAYRSKHPLIQPQDIASIKASMKAPIANRQKTHSQPVTRARVIQDLVQIILRDSVAEFNRYVNPGIAHMIPDIYVSSEPPYNEISPKEKDGCYLCDLAAMLHKPNMTNHLVHDSHSATIALSVALCSNFLNKPSAVTSDLVNTIKILLQKGANPTLTFSILGSRKNLNEVGIQLLTSLVKEHKDAKQADSPAPAQEVKVPAPIQQISRTQIISDLVRIILEDSVEKFSQYLSAHSGVANMIPTICVSGEPPYKEFQPRQFIYGWPLYQLAAMLHKPNMTNHLINDARSATIALTTVFNNELPAQPDDLIKTINILLDKNADPSTTFNSLTFKASSNHASIELLATLVRLHNVTKQANSPAPAQEVKSQPDQPSHAHAEEESIKMSILKNLDATKPETLSTSLRLIAKEHCWLWPLYTYEISKKLNWIPADSQTPPDLRSEQIGPIMQIVIEIRKLNDQSDIQTINKVFQNIIRQTPNVQYILSQQVADRINKPLDEVVYRCPKCNTLNMRTVNQYLLNKPDKCYICGGPFQPVVPIPSHAAI